MIHDNHSCCHTDCSKWGAFGENLPDVPEADFPTRWYCRRHLPDDYYGPTARDRLRRDYRQNKGAAPPSTPPVPQPLQRSLFA